MVRASLLLVLALSAPALGQDLQQRWANGLAEAAHTEEAQVQRGEIEGGRMVGVRLGDLDVMRLRFEDEAEAVEYARTYFADPYHNEGTSLVEVRGTQVLMMRGEALSDADQASRLRDAGWEVLGGGDGTSQATIATQGGRVAGEGPAARRIHPTVERAEDSELAGYFDGLAPKGEGLPLPGVEREVTPAPARPRSQGYGFSDVVVVGIDQATQAELGAFGGSYRGIHAELIGRLVEAGARGIAFDVYFPDNPEQAEGTEALARAAGESSVPVVVAVYTEEQGGETAVLPNASVFQQYGVREGAVAAGSELVLPGGVDVANAEFRRALAEGRDPNFGYSIGEWFIRSESGGYRPLVEELMIATGDLPAGGFAGVGMVEQILTGLEGNAEGGIEGVYTGGIRPSLSTRQEVTHLSYADVLAGRGDLSALQGALVLVGITDGEQDIIQDPNPADAGDVAEVHGVYLHAFAAANGLIESAGSGDTDPGDSAPVAGPETDGLRGRLERAR